MTLISVHVYEVLFDSQAASHSGNRPLHLAALAIACRPIRNMNIALSCIIELLDQGAGGG